MSAVRKSFGDEASYHQLARLIQDVSGINLHSGKEFLMETRLSARLRDLGLDTLDDYLRLMREDSEEAQHCIEMLTTHKTEWFREIVHYQWLKKELPRMRAAGGEVKIWSAACSTGPEIYSVLFLLLREGLDPARFRLLGTDISRPVLAAAETLPSTAEFAEQLACLRARVPSGRNVEDEVRRALETSLKFREFNLVESSLDSSVQFDVIFLRNVLIYFDRPTVVRVCQRLARNLKPGGHLILGLSETLYGEIPELVSIGQSIYRLEAKRRA